MKFTSRQVADPAAQQNFEQLQTAVFDTGDLKPTMRATAPIGWVLAQGQTINAADFPELARAMGAAGATFTLPDLRGRVPVGAGTGAGLTARALAATGGLEGVTLTTAQIPAHTHPPNGTGTFMVNDGTGGAIPAGATHSTPTRLDATTGQNAGGGGSHENMPPFFVVNWLIKT